MCSDNASEHRTGNAEPYFPLARICAVLCATYLSWWRKFPAWKLIVTVFEKKSARRRSVCLLVAAALIGGVGASGPVAAADPEVRRSLEALSHLDAMTAQVGYRIVTANAALCERQMPASGMLLHGIEQYGAEFRATAAEMFSLGTAPGVALVLGGSPAAKAGVQPGDALIAINGEAMPGTGPEGGKGAARGDFDRMAVVFDQMEAALKKGPVTLSLMRKGEPVEVRFSGAPACESRFQVLPDNALNAAADGRYVQISTAFIPYFKNEDEFAAILAHEVAHNILRHRDRLDEQKVPSGILRKFGKNAARIRATEIEADVFSLKLLANAGYRLEAAPEFWRRFGPEHGYGIFSDATHLRWKKRVELLEGEIAELRAQPAAAGADAGAGAGGVAPEKGR